MGHGYLTLKEIYLTNLLVTDKDQLWCLATNLPDIKMALHFYARRVFVRVSILNHQVAKAKVHSLYTILYSD